MTKDNPLHVCGILTQLPMLVSSRVSVSMIRFESSFFQRKHENVVHLLFKDFCAGLSLALNYFIILQTCIWIWFWFPAKTERGIPPKEPPTQSQTHSVSSNQSRTLSPTHSLNPRQNLPSEGISLSIFSGSIEDFFRDSRQGWISAEGSGFTGFWFDGEVPLCLVKDMPESSGLGVAKGQFSPSICRVLHLQRNVTFSAKRTSLWILPKKFSLVVSLDLLPQGRF